jgi:hypothetical protein
MEFNWNDHVKRCRFSSLEHQVAVRLVFQNLGFIVIAGRKIVLT